MNPVISTVPPTVLISPAATSARISLEQVQQATARCLLAHPAVDAMLSKESHLLAELLGRMIYARSEAMDVASLSAATLDELQRWSPPPGLRAAA